VLLYFGPEELVYLGATLDARASVENLSVGGLGLKFQEGYRPQFLNGFDPAFVLKKAKVEVSIAKACC
jgi:hypothetical protein